MNKRFESSVAGDFLGWTYGVTYILDNATVWSMCDSLENNPGYDFCPKATLWEDGEKLMLEIDGHGKREVSPVILSEKEQPIVDLMAVNPAKAATLLNLLASDAFRELFEIGELDLSAWLHGTSNPQNDVSG